jgi:hypothetical protein
MTLLHREPNLDSLTENLCSKTNLNHHTNILNDSLSKNNLNKNTQLCLTLTNRFTPNGDEKTDLNNLFIRLYYFVISKINNTRLTTKILFNNFENNFEEQKDSS